MQEELKWFASFPKELEEDAIDVLEKAKKEFPKDKPVLAYVPREETLILSGD